MSMQKIPHDTARNVNNPIELLKITDRVRIGRTIYNTPTFLMPGTIDDIAGHKAITAYGNAAVSTAQSKIVNSSIYFDGTGDYLTTPEHSDFHFAAENFTIHAWIYIPTFGVYGIFGIGGNSGYWNSTGNELSFFTYTGNVLYGQWQISSGVWGNVISDNLGDMTGAWHHTALIRNGDEIKSYWDGVNVGTAYISGSIVAVSSGTPVTLIGNLPGRGNPFYGYIALVSVTKGAAIWTSNFTPPSLLSYYYSLHNYIGV